MDRQHMQNTKMDMKRNDDNSVPEKARLFQPINFGEANRYSASLDPSLVKEPGCGRTPWHCDDHHFPLATQDVVTAWIPAHPIPVLMVPLAFAKPFSVFDLVKNINFNKYFLLWSPWNTVASWYLWRNIDQEIISY